MRILHIINGEFYSGAERVQDLLAICLKDFGYDVGFACIKHGIFANKRVSKSKLMHFVPMHSCFDVGCGFRLAKTIQHYGYKIVHTHTPRAAMVGRIASALARVPMVHHVHSPTARDTESPLRNTLNSFIERLSLVGVDRLIPVSASLANYLEKGFTRKIIRMVPNGVPAMPRLPERVRMEEWVLGTVALFRPRKGVEVLIEALAELRTAGQRVRLRAVGPFISPEYERELMVLAERLGVKGAIDWVGFTSDVNAELKLMDLFVLPSLYGEGMPMVILEAMAMGVPVVASNVEGIPEVIEHGLSGMIVSAGDVSGLINVLRSMMNGECDWYAMRQRAWERQSSLFSDVSMAFGVSEVYKEIL